MGLLSVERGILTTGAAGRGGGTVTDPCSEGGAALERHYLCVLH